MNLVRQEILIKKLLQYRFRNYNLNLIKVEVYDTFQDDKYMCRVEIFKEGTEIKNRFLKYENYLDQHFGMNLDKKLMKHLLELEEAEKTLAVK